MCALDNLRAISGPDNMVALASLVEMLSSPHTHTRWAASEGIVLVGGKGNRELLCWLVIAMDSKNILDPFVVSFSKIILIRPVAQEVNKNSRCFFPCPHLSVKL